MDILAPYREKWREVPGGDDDAGRHFSTDMLTMPDGEFLALWEAHAAKRVAGSLSWLGSLYRDFFTGRRILELGSGLGLDGLRFTAQGAQWTFADIAADNLKVIERVASLKGLRVKTFLIGNDLSFDALGGQFDAVLASGSMHHVPFEMAREECLSVLRRLKPGGRWIELAYPKERWSATVASRSTSGERPPMAIERRGQSGTTPRSCAPAWHLPHSPRSSTSASSMTTFVGSTCFMLLNSPSRRCSRPSPRLFSAFARRGVRRRTGHISSAWKAFAKPKVRSDRQEEGRWPAAANGNVAS